MSDKKWQGETHTHTHTLKIFNNYFSSTATMIKQTRLSVVHIKLSILLATKNLRFYLLLCAKWNLVSG